jgi:uncharacterized protein
MRGIPSSILVFFFVLVILVELISYIGLWQITQKASAKTKWYLGILFFLISCITTGLLLYSFSDTETIRQSRNYSLFYTVIVVSILNLIPKLFFATMTIFSYFTQKIVSLHLKRIVLSGSFLISSGLFIVIAYGTYIGRYQLFIEKKNLHFDNLPQQLDGFKIVQISDIHLGSFNGKTKLMEEVVKRANQLQPDLLLFTGDIVNNFSDEMDGFEPFLAQFLAKYGKYAIQGNHDYGDYYEWPDSVSKRNNLNQIERGLTGAGFKLLLNQWDKIIVKDTSFALIGVENWGQRPFPQYANLNAAMNGIPSNLFKILMTHDPAHWDAIVVPQTDIPLTLSGHTHGGQLGIKMAGIEFSPIYFVQKHWGGLYESDNQYLYVNRGIGTIGFLGRIEMKPEITLLILHRTKTH